MSTNALRESAVNNMDVTVRYGETPSPIKQVREVIEPGDNIYGDALENKENFNISNFIKLDDTVVLKTNGLDVLDNTFINEIPILDISQFNEIGVGLKNNGPDILQNTFLEEEAHFLDVSLKNESGDSSNKLRDDSKNNGPNVMENAFLEEEAQFLDITLQNVSGDSSNKLRDDSKNNGPNVMENAFLEEETQFLDISLKNISGQSSNELNFDSKNNRPNVMENAFLEEAHFLDIPLNTVSGESSNALRVDSKNSGRNVLNNTFLEADVHFLESLKKVSGESSEFEDEQTANEFSLSRLNERFFADNEAGSNNIIQNQEKEDSEHLAPFVYSNHINVRCINKPRESLLTTFDPLYQSEETPINVSILCKEILSSIIEEVVQADIVNINDSEINCSLNCSTNQTVYNMADVSDKLKLSLMHEDNDISILEYPSDINDTEKVTLLEEQISEIKLQLNASQQMRINLELQLRQKEEVFIKNQAELSRKEQLFQKEIKQLKEKLETPPVENADDRELKELQDMVKELKSQEANLLREVAHRRADELEYQKIMEAYEKKISTQATQLQKFQEEHETVKCHLGNLELAFSDLHQKYERAKKIIEGYKSNEMVLKESITSAHECVRKSEDKYDTLKSHAKAQIEKSNLEIQAVREQYESEILKLTAIVRRLEIKVNSLTDSLDQKTKECVALSALCDEVTGQNVI